MNSLVLTLLLTAVPCENETKNGPADKLLACAETQAGVLRRYLFARAFYRLGSLEAGDHEAAQARLLATKEQVETMNKDFTAARKDAEQQHRSQCLVVAQRAGFTTGSSGGFSFEGLKKFDALSETERDKLQSLDVDELKVLLGVPRADLEKAKARRGLVLEPAPGRSDSKSGDR